MEEECLSLNSEPCALFRGWAVGLQGVVSVAATGNRFRGEANVLELGDAAPYGWRRAGTGYRESEQSGETEGSRLWLTMRVFVVSMLHILILSYSCIAEGEGKQDTSQHKKGLLVLPVIY